MDPTRIDELSKALSNVEAGLEGSMKRLVEGQLDSLTQVGIVRELLAGKRTLAELVEALYGLKRQDDGFKTEYTRIRREVRALESKGFVSRALFGRERPYRLTQLAVARITKIAEVTPSWQPKLVTPIDFGIYVVAMLLAAVGFVMSRNLDDPWAGLQALRYAAAFFGGLAFSRFAGTVRKVV